MLNAFDATLGVVFGGGGDQLGMTDMPITKWVSPL
jgi:hypothetical protein